MDNNKTSLIKKILSKGSVFTSFEIIHLEYLNKKGILQQLIDIENKQNPYLAMENAKTIVSPMYLSWLRGFAIKEDPELHKAYNYAYDRLWELDNNVSIFGYRGLALLAELISFRNEYLLNFIFEESEEKRKKEIAENFRDIGYSPVFDFSTYSFVHQREVTFTQVLHSLTITFKTLMKMTDDILTLNYYLDRLIDMEDLDCLKFLKMWLNDGTGNLNEDDHKPFFNAALIHSKPEENILFILNANHKNYVNYLKTIIKNIPASFEENSLRYVKDKITETVNSITKAEDNIKL